MIALEPEAASIYCMHLPVHKDTENSTFGVFKSGSKYMVVDAGGNVNFFLFYRLSLIEKYSITTSLTICLYSKL